MESKEFIKTVLERDKAKSRLNTEFSTFTDPEEEESITISEFFEAYDTLFFDIPEEGELESHRVLIERSSEYINFQRSTEDIQPLLDEITSLREQLLQLRIEQVEGQIDEAIEGIEED